ncbi:MAG: acyltransferase family protein [Pseudobdellovibrio sp.]
MKKNIFFVLDAKKYFKEIFATNDKQDSLIGGIRAFSVLSIIAFHVTVGIIQVYDFEKSKNYILNMPWYLQPLWHGEKGVDAFFLISALVLGIPLFKKIESFDWQATKDFYRKRFFRIYPLFFVALLLYTAGQWSYFGKYFFSNLFLINNLIPGERTIIPVGWSLLVEVQYYALLPILLWVLAKSKHRLKILIALFVSSFATCGYRLLTHPQLYQRHLTDIFLAKDRSEFTSQLGEFMYESNMTRYGAFSVGLILAYLKVRHEDKVKQFFQNQLAGISALTLAIVFILFGAALPLYHPDSFYYQNFSENLNFFVFITQRQSFSTGLMLIILGCWYSNWLPFVNLKKFFSAKFWLPFSRLSFPIYLFHFPFVAVAAVLVFGTVKVEEITHVSFTQGALIFVLAALFTVLFSIPLYVFIERPFIEKGKKLNKNKSIS